LHAFFLFWQDGKAPNSGNPATVSIFMSGQFDLCAHCPGFKGYPDPCAAQVQWDQVDCPQKYSTICGVCPATRRQMWINRALPASIRAPMVPDPCGTFLIGVQQGMQPMVILALMPTALRCGGMMLFSFDFAVVSVRVH